MSGDLPSHLWQARLAPDAKPYRGRHRFHGVEVVPASVVLHTLLCAADELGYSALSAVRFDQPVFADQPRLIQVVADDQSISLASRPADTASDRWTRHVTARLSSAPVEPALEAPQQTHARLDDDIPDITEQLALRGVEGLPFKWALDSWEPTPTGVHAAIDLPDALPDGSAGPLLDAAVILGALSDVDDARLYVPAGIEQVWLRDTITEPRGAVQLTHTGRDSEGITLDVTAAARGGAPCLSMQSLRYRVLDIGATPSAGSHEHSDPRTFVHTLDWQPRVDRSEALGPGTLAVLGEDASALRDRLGQYGFGPGTVSDARYVLYVAESRPADATETDVDFAVRVCAEVSAAVRTLAQRTDSATLWIVTRGVHESATPPAVRQSFLWGLAGVIAAEHPELWGGLVDLADSGVLDESALARRTASSTRASRSWCCVRVSCSRRR